MLCWVSYWKPTQLALKEQKEKGKHVILAVTMALHDCSQLVALLADTFLYTVSSERSLNSTIWNNISPDLHSREIIWKANGDVCVSLLFPRSSFWRTRTQVISHESLSEEMSLRSYLCLGFPRHQSLQFKRNIYLNMNSNISFQMFGS